MLISPREYQSEALEAVSEFRTNGITRQLITLPTGCGKTVVFALLAKEINTRTLVLAHTEELIAQAYPFSGGRKQLFKSVEYQRFSYLPCHPEGTGSKQLIFASH